VALAEVARPHGVQGELRLKVYNDDSDLLLHQKVVRLRFEDGTERDVRLSHVRPTNNALLVKMEGVEDRNAAEAMRGVRVCLDRADFPALEEGEFYACDVEGADAVLSSGERVGSVKTIKSYPTCDVLVVERDGGDLLEVPLVEGYIASVHVGSGSREAEAERPRVVLVTVDGL
jgi:16S rRNA processing protein RimM